MDMEYGIWNMEYGIWNMGYGIWNMEYGIWNMEYEIKVKFLLTLKEERGLVTSDFLRTYY